ncbi:MAG: methionine--tRNA ligase subunit beta [Minisyncoccia bacterium]
MTEEKNVTPDVGSNGAGDQKAEIAYDDFAKLDIRVGMVVAAEMVEGADKLIRCTIDFGDFGTRTIVSGIALFRKPEEIVGKQLPYIVNLAPRVIRGVESQGMLLAASPGGEGLALLIPDNPVPNGTKLK